MGVGVRIPPSALTEDTSLFWGVESALLLKRSSGLSSSGDDALVGLLIEVARAEEAYERYEQRVTEFPGERHAAPSSYSATRWVLLAHDRMRSSRVNSSWPNLMAVATIS